MTTLPRPDVATTRPTDSTGPTDLDVVISRDGKARTYSTRGKATVQEAVTEVVRQIIDDPVSRELLP